MLTLITTNISTSNNWSLIYQNLGVGLAIVSMCLLLHYLNNKNKKTYGKAKS